MRAQKQSTFLVTCEPVRSDQGNNQPSAGNEVRGREVGPGEARFFEKGRQSALRIPLVDPVGGNIAEQQVSAGRLRHPDWSLNEPKIVFLEGLQFRVGRDDGVEGRVKSEDRLARRRLRLRRRAEQSENRYEQKTAADIVYL